MVVDKNIELEEVQCANKSLRINQNALTEDFDKLTKDILIIEKEWEFLLLIQVHTDFIRFYEPYVSMGGAHLQE